MSLFNKNRFNPVGLCFKEGLFFLIASAIVSIASFLLSRDLAVAIISLMVLWASTLFLADNSLKSQMIKAEIDVEPKSEGERIIAELKKEYAKKESRYLQGRTRYMGLAAISYSVLTLAVSIVLNFMNSSKYDPSIISGICASLLLLCLTIRWSSLKRIGRKYE